MRSRRTVEVRNWGVVVNIRPACDIGRKRTMLPTEPWITASSSAHATRESSGRLCWPCCTTRRLGAVPHTPRRSHHQHGPQQQEQTLTPRSAGPLSLGIAVVGTSRLRQTSTGKLASIHLPTSSVNHQWPIRSKSGSSPHQCEETGLSVQNSCGRDTPQRAGIALREARSTTEYTVAMPPPELHLGWM